MLALFFSIFQKVVLLMHVFKSVCQPTLMYGLDAISLSKSSLKQLESAQAGIVKQVCGLPKRHHHTDLLSSLSVNTCKNVINQSTLSLFHRIFLVRDSPSKTLCTHLIAMYINTGRTIPGTIVDRIVRLGFSPVKCLFTKPSYVTSNTVQPNGLVDSLKTLLFNDNYIKPWSSEYNLVKLLTKSF